MKYLSKNTTVLNSPPSTIMRKMQIRINPLMVNLILYTEIQPTQPTINSKTPVKTKFQRIISNFVCFMKG
jgi:hypothetical protein